MLLLPLLLLLLELLLLLLPVLVLLLLLLLLELLLLLLLVLLLVLLLLLLLLELLLLLLRRAVCLSWLRYEERGHLSKRGKVSEILKWVGKMLRRCCVPCSIRDWGGYGCLQRA